MRIIREFRDFNSLIFESKDVCPFLFTDSSTDEEYHQAILDVGYNWWQDKNSEVNSYSDMIYKMDKDFGYKFALLVLLGKYNHQVGNGGHIQYFDNGYASAGSSGFGGNHKNIELHYKMIEWFKNSGLDEIKIGKKIYDIMVESGEIFEEMTEGDQECDMCDGNGEIEEICYNCDNGIVMNTCPECDGSGEIEVGEEYEECPNCGGSGEIEQDCSDCDGDGKIYSTCSECDGNGNIDNYKMYGEILNRLDTQYYNIDGWEEVLNEFSKDILKEKYPEEWKRFLVRKETKKYNL
ncbi:hypothetical protein K9L67_05990 [Candidatus Woesearchaeota archaeon]|nr:hypothetical protein [Candidatus Woesearchaeota archaeon]MCF7901744.1 hypothetical protein [Candidatus Woesearchaeota archaeon]